MALRDKITANVEPHLQEGEQVEAAFSAQTQSAYWMLVSFLIVLLLANRYRSVVVTDRRIIVCDAGRWSSTKCNEIVRELPRSTTIGPPDARLWWRCETLGETLRIHRRFWADVEAADAAAPA